MTDPHPFDRAREAHLLEHPEDATPDDVRDAMLSLRAMRDAAREQAEAGGGVAVVCTMYTRNGSLRVGFTAPAMDDERVAALAARSIKLLAKPAEKDKTPPEPAAPLDGPLKVIAVGFDRDGMHSTLAELPDRCAIVILAGGIKESLEGAREARALLYQSARVVPRDA